MIQNFKKFILNKYFLVWVLIFLYIIYIYGEFFVNQKKDIMFNSNIEDMK